MKVKTDYASNAYLTPGKEYKVIEKSEVTNSVSFLAKNIGKSSDNLQVIQLENGDYIAILLAGCAHIGGNDWEIIND